jgi:hypothetical protein
MAYYVVVGMCGVLRLILHFVEKIFWYMLSMMHFRLVNWALDKRVFWYKGLFA